MKDVVHYNNQKMFVREGSTLREIVNLIVQIGKVETRITGIKRISNSKTGQIVWEIFSH